MNKGEAGGADAPRRHGQGSAGRLKRKIRSGRLRHHRATRNEKIFHLSDNLLLLTTWQIRGGLKKLSHFAGWSRAALLGRLASDEEMAVSRTTRPTWPVAPRGRLWVPVPKKHRRDAKCRAWRQLAPVSAPPLPVTHKAAAQMAGAGVLKECPVFMSEL